MTTEDERISYLAGYRDGSELTADDRAGLNELRAQLADASTWAEPDAALEDRIVAAIATGSATRGPVDAPAPAPPRAIPPASPDRRHQRSRPATWRIVAVAAAILAVLGIAGVLLATRGGSGGAGLEVALSPTDLVPGATGTANVSRTPSGWRVELSATGLPRLDQGRFYEAWLRNADGTLVSLGTFNEGVDVTLWGGVSPREFPTLTVTEEVADGNPASSGRRVLVGTIQVP